MRKIRVIGLVIVVLLLVAAMVLFYTGYFKPKGAGVLIESTPASTVYIDGEQVGRTPFKETRSPGEITVRLVPDSFDQPLVPYSTKVTLVSGIETVVRREFGATDDTSAGEVLSFEKVGGDEAGLSIVSIPDSAQITLDVATKAFTPYKTSSLAVGKHTISISTPGYVERNIDVKTYKGYKLTVFVQLAKSNEPVPTPTVEQQEEEDQKEMVEILSTPTGFLRVRSEPSTLGSEVGQVEPGEQYPLLETDEDTGWYKIEFGESQEGWVSSQYAEIVGGSATPTPTPKTTSTPTPTTRSASPTPEE